MKKHLAWLLALTLCLGLLGGCGTQSETGETGGEDDAGALTPVVITEEVRGYHWAPAYLAETLGYFEEEGLDVSFETVSGADGSTPVLSGEAQFCLKGIETALVVNEQGQGMKVLVSTTQKYPYQLIGASEDYSTLESLRGGTVAGGKSANSGPYSFAMACMNKAGLVPETDVNVITMGSAGYAAAIQAGELQGAVSTNPWSAKKLLDAGGVVIVDGTDDAVIEGIIGSASYELFTVMTSDALIESDPELVQKAVNAMARAMQWMETATPEEIAEQLLPLFEGAEEELLYDAQYDKERGLANYKGYHSESGYQAAITLTKLAGSIQEGVAPEVAFDESFLDKAWESLK